MDGGVVVVLGWGGHFDGGSSCSLSLLSVRDCVLGNCWVGGCLGYVVVKVGEMMFGSGLVCLGRGGWDSVVSQLDYYVAAMSFRGGAYYGILEHEEQ